MRPFVILLLLLILLPVSAQSTPTSNPTATLEILAQD